MSKLKLFLGVIALALALTAGSAFAYTHTVTLREGSSGSQVAALQQALGIMADGKFGPMTKSAVMAFQSANGLTPDGVVGPMTGAKLSGSPTYYPPTSGNYPAGCTSSMGWSATTGAKCDGSSSGNFPSGCTSSMGYSPTTGAKCDGSSSPSTPSTGSLEGTDGTISDITQLGQYSAEEVGSGSENVTVLGFEIEASSDGDISLNSMKVRFDSTGNVSGDSDRLEDYIESVSIWQGSTEVGSADASDFTRVSSGLYTKVVTLDSSVVKADEKEKFYVAVNGVGNLDSGDIDSDSWTVALDNIRYEDGGGVVTTETAEIPADMDWDTAGDGVSLAFVSYSSASDTELKISTNSTPDSATVAVDSTENTDDVLMLKGKMTVEGDSDVWLDELPFTFTNTGDGLVAMTANATLTIDGQTFSETISNSTSSAPTVTFNDLDLTIDAGDTVNFTVSVDMNDLEDTGAPTTDFDAGDQLTVSLTTTNRASIIAENEQGDQLTDSTEMTGSATGNAMTFRLEGVNVELGTVTYTKTEDTSGNVTLQTFTIPVTVTSFGNTLYIGQAAQFATTATASNAFAVVFENSSTPTTADVTSSASVALSSTDALISSNGYVLDEDDAKHFTIEVTQITPGLLGAVSAGNYRVRLDELRVFTDAALSAAAAATNIDLVPTTDFRTAFKYITS